MCRIMAVTNLTKIEPEKLNEHLTQIRDLVCEANKDGFGLGLSFKKSTYAEKFTDPKDFKGIGLSSLDSKLDHPLFWYNGSLSYGELPSDERPLAGIFHGRTSTNYKGMPEYSHPFVNEKSGDLFIHNGVVSIPKDHEFDLITKNDSEYLANVHWSKGINGVKDSEGYYAYLNLKKNGVTQLVKDDMANLYGAYCKTLNGYIFATIENMIHRYAKALKLEITAVMPVTDCFTATIRLDAIKNQSEFTKAQPMARELTAKERKAFKDYDSTEYSGPVATVKRKLEDIKTDTKSAYLSDEDEDYYYSKFGGRYDY
jgi:predicted glutamine amidotransferase